MTVLSKLFGERLGMKLSTANCYETCHTWNPNCWGALVDVTWDGWAFCFKTYFTLYVVSQFLVFNNNLLDL